MFLAFITQSLSLLGGFSETKIDQVDAKIVSHLKSHLKTAVKSDVHEIISVEKQVVAGMNYRFTVKVGDKTGTVVIWKKLSGDVVVTKSDFGEKGL